MEKDWERVQVQIYGVPAYAEALVNALKREFWCVCDFVDMDGEFVVRVSAEYSAGHMRDIHQFVQGFNAAIYANLNR